MAYATQADLVPLRITNADLAELTSEDSTVDDTVVQSALDEASSRVDAYCGQRYKTPLQPSGLAKAITIDIALFLLFSGPRRNVPETIANAHTMAMAMLRDIAAGKASLDQPITAAQPQTSSADVTVPTTPQVFDECNTRGYF
jgi:phage gp36-like protein